jgi:regulator of protease activity HflC (stomatin/prohibitin superfamily)
MKLFILPVLLGTLGWALIVISGIILLLLALSLKRVKQTQKIIVERFGGYHRTLGVGIHLIIPGVEQISKIVSLKEQIKDFDPQAVITKDNVTMQIDTVVFFSVTDPKLFTYGTENPIIAIENLSATTLRNIIGDLDLDETLTSRDLINTKMRIILDEATDAWGIKVHRVEVKNIIPPKDIRESMEKQMRAEREKRQTILIAEGDKRSAILRAEGEAEALVLRAEAYKKEKILQAEGDASAIFKIKEAEALGIKVIKEAGADQNVLTLKSLEALALVANGQATKIIVPTNITDIAATVMMAAEIARENKK